MRGRRPGHGHGRGAPVVADTLWWPPGDVREATHIGRYLAWLEAERGLRFDTYHDLWRWSVQDLAGFWGSVWDHFEVGPPQRSGTVLAERAMPGARWFTEARLNYAEQALRLPGRGDDETVVVSRSQTRPPMELTAAELRRQVAACRAGLERLGVGSGDRVAAYLPNIAEAVVALLATASVGAVWSSCAPEFGTRSVVDRLAQIEPAVLLTVDGYRYGNKVVDRSAEVAAIREALPSLRHTVLVPYLDPAAEVPGALSWDGLLAEPGPLTFQPVAFDHPLYVLYSSGTTGLPKPIVHGHGGMVMAHLVALALHGDLGAGDRFFWFSTTGWMMWNYLVSGLLVGSTVVLFDGNPGVPDLSALWSMAAEEGVTSFGTSAPFLMACRKAGLRPGDEVDLSDLRAVGSTGAPLPAEGFRWVYDAVKGDVLLGSISGGTDVCTAFVGMVPLLPVRAGRISCRCLGCAVQAYGPDGQPVVGTEGELAVTEPMPSMPVGFWGDGDGSRYRAAYFEDFPGVWRHGDWITVHDDGSCTITGRSDATLNRGGVRLGTSELYSVVESLPEVDDSLVVHLDDPAGEGSGRLVLFVVPAEGCEVDDALRSRIAAELRTSLSPRHVPDEIREVAGVPRTLSGKKLEVPVKRILTGTPVDAAASRGALANPEVLDEYARYPRQ